MRRKKIVTNRKKFEINWRFVRAVVSIFLWTLLVVQILFIDPSLEGSVFVFLTLVFTFFAFFISTLTNNIRQILIYPFCIVLFLILGYFGIGNILNFLLLVGILASIELYFR